MMIWVATILGFISCQIKNLDDIKADDTGSYPLYCTWFTSLMNIDKSCGLE